MSWTDVFDSIEPDALKDLALLASGIAAAPIALVTLFDGQRHWFTALVGVTAIPDVPWEKTFCAHAIQNAATFVVEDAAADSRFADHPLVCAEGVRFYAAAPLIAGGRAIGTLCVMDVEARTLSPGSRESLAALARQVVTQLQLRFQARELATVKAGLERSDRQRRDFIANISHDLRTPLASLRGYIDTVLLKDQALSQQTRGHLEHAAALSQSAAGLVSDLFELSFLDAADDPLTLDRFPLAELTRDVVHGFGALAKAKEIGLSVAGEDCPAFVYGDVRLLERVLWNLLDNAVRFTMQGGRVSVTCESTASRVVVRVENTGSTVSDIDRHRVFERFYGAAGSSAPSTGLGLAIARRIVELHEGEIRVGYRSNNAAEFEFSIPRAEVPAL